MIMPVVSEDWKNGAVSNQLTDFGRGLGGRESIEGVQRDAGGYKDMSSILADQ